jgi:hypothetical protein
VGMFHINSRVHWTRNKVKYYIVSRGIKQLQRDVHGYRIGIERLEKELGRVEKD